jgi:hypothetical protein
MIFAKVAACAALGVALFPCGCGHEIPCAAYSKAVKSAHFGCAAAMFLVLAYFCVEFLRRDIGKGHTRAKIRIFVHGVCAIGILLSILILGLSALISHLVNLNE